MTGFYDLPETKRFRIYGAVDSLQCQTIGGSSDGSFQVAVAKGALSDLIAFMRGEGFKDVDLHYFPLGSDKPAEILRHDSFKYGVKACNWLYCTFQYNA